MRTFHNDIDAVFIKGKNIDAVIYQYPHMHNMVITFRHLHHTITIRFRAAIAVIIRYPHIK
jgi:hypothetical protein